MKYESNINELKGCLRLLAASMGYEALPSKEADALINHVLFDGEYNGAKGKEGWASFEEGLITKMELQNLITEHAATKISNFNRKAEPSSKSYLNTNLVSKISSALFGAEKNA